MFIIGITGGIGCGKSSVADICREYGLTVIDADAISREVTSENGLAINEIEENFGKKILAGNRSLNRKAISELVFNDKKALDRLSAIVHKHVIAQIKIKIAEYDEKKIKALALDVPIPVKNGFLDVCNQIWVVWADDDIRVKRLLARGMNENESKRRMKNQMNKDEYFALAEKIILNNDSLEELKVKVIQHLDEELHSRGIKLAPIKTKIN